MSRRERYCCRPRQQSHPTRHYYNRWWRYRIWLSKDRLPRDRSHRCRR